MSETAAFPVWEEREQPTLYLIDNDEDELAELPWSTEGEHFGVADEINSIRGPLQEDARRAHPLLLARLEDKEVDLPGVAGLVATALERQPYPAHRFVVDSELTHVSTAFQQAWRRGLVSRGMYDSDGTINVEAVDLLGIVRFRGEALSRASKAGVMYMVVRGAAQAAMQGLVRIKTLPSFEDSEPVSWENWSGYSWRYQGKQYGHWLSDAVIEHMATSVCRDLELMPKPRGVHPAIVPYYQRWSRVYSIAGTVLIDRLTQGLGKGGNAQTIRDLVYRLSDQPDDQAAREELSATVLRATKRQVPLEALEAVPSGGSRQALAVLDQVEIAVGIDASKRVTDVLNALRR